MERSNSSPRKKYNNIPSDKTGYSASGSSESLDSHDGKAKITRRKSCPERHHARPRLWSNISSDSDIQGINLKELTQVQPSSSAFDSLFLEDRETVVENLCDSTEHLKSVSELHSGDSSESLSCDDYVVPGEEENPQAHVSRRAVSSPYFVLRYTIITLFVLLTTEREYSSYYHQCAHKRTRWYDYNDARDQIERVEDLLDRRSDGDSSKQLGKWQATSREKSTDSSADERK